MSQRASTVNGARLGGRGMPAGENITKATRISLHLPCTPLTLQLCAVLWFSWLVATPANGSQDGSRGSFRTRPDTARQSRKKEAKKPQRLLTLLSGSVRLCPAL